MAQWLVTQGKQQFSVDGMSEIKKLLRGGDLGAGDLIQPPGTTEWMYVLEVPELRALARDDDGDDDSFGTSKAGLAMVTVGITAFLSLVVVVFGGAMFFFSSRLPTTTEHMIGKGGMYSYSQMLVTEVGSGLRGRPEAESAVGTSVPKDQVLELLAKRGDFYRARYNGAEGWIPVNHVIPIYQLGGENVREEYDPLYNPDRYFEVANASWQQLPDAEENVTVFEFMLQNRSRYAMTDLVILATIKDARGQELERVEIPIEGIIPPEGRTMVGTLVPEEPVRSKKKAEDEPEPRSLTEFTFRKMAEDDPDLQLAYSAGVSATMTTEDFSNATIDPLELRAIPDEEASKVVSQTAQK
jgi:hypothetical protein